MLAEWPAEEAQLTAATRVPSMRDLMRTLSVVDRESEPVDEGPCGCSSATKARSSLVRDRKINVVNGNAGM
jgi:hypothetical protein